MINWIKSLFRKRTQDEKDIILLKRLKNYILINRSDVNILPLFGHTPLKGLCAVVLTMVYCKLLTDEEHERLLFLIRSNRPQFSLSYYFEPGLLTPRVKFINNIIKNIKDKDLKRN